jgi:lipopolysaccharide/colanic/teichoic acid biosynthesis glycosyltransferase
MFGVSRQRALVWAIVHSRSPEAEDTYASHSLSTWCVESQFRIKRAFDIVASILAIIVLLPLLALIAIAIKTTSRGPIFFKQIRWGAGGRKIKVFKFRSMREELCDASGVSQTVNSDPRITAVGSWLRKSNLDELPQLLNVLRGDMSLVGPRCHPVGMLAAGRPYEELVHNYHLRHAVRPGITGLAQIRGLRGPTVEASKARQRIACDLYYIKHYSLWLDLKIILRTIRNEALGGSGF